MNIILRGKKSEPIAVKPCDRVTFQEIPGFEFGVYVNKEGTWDVSECRSGYWISHAHASKLEAIAAALAVLLKHGVARVTEVVGQYAKLAEDYDFEEAMRIAQSM